jgi:hypothetical protein
MFAIRDDRYVALLPDFVEFFTLISSPPPPRTGNISSRRILPKAARKVGEAKKHESKIHFPSTATWI